MKFRSAYDGENDAASAASGLECQDESKAVQSEKENCDINVIMKRFGVTGQLPVSERVALSGDFREFIPDLGETLRSIRSADAMYQALPEGVRRRFKSQQEFVAYCLDSGNIEELREMGLARKPEKEDGERGDVSVVNRGTPGGAPASRVEGDSAGSARSGRRASDVGGGQRVSEDAAGRVDEGS